MSPLYRLGHWIGRFIFFRTMHSEVINALAVRRTTGYVLAVTHVSHLEPMCLSILNHRPIDRITRKEFFRFRAIGWLLYALGAIKINRQGIPVSSIREVIARARAGRTIGICPERFRNDRPGRRYPPGDDQKRVLFDRAPRGRTGGALRDARHAPPERGWAVDSIQKSADLGGVRRANVS